jgi:predicted SAM-dependent methyltransferase
MLLWPYYKFKAAIGTYNGAKVNLGAGASKLKGWISVDGNPLRRPDIWMEIRNPWPFQSNSLAGIVTSHLLEHLFDHELKHVLREMYRVLIPGGFARISVPSLEKAVYKYLNSKDEENKGEQFHLTCHWHGAHHQIFDFGRLGKLLSMVGFIHIQACQFPCSNFLNEAEVFEIDRHPEESLFVECIKPKDKTHKNS